MCLVYFGYSALEFYELRYPMATIAIGEYGYTIILIPLFRADWRIGLTVNAILDLLADRHDDHEKQQIILKINVE